MRHMWTRFRHLHEGIKGDDQPSIDVSRLMLDARHQDASAPSDKVYALYRMLDLMGVAVAALEHPMPVNKVYRQATVSAINQDKSFLVLAGLTEEPDTLELSSVVADWSNYRPVP